MLRVTILMVSKMTLRQMEISKGTYSGEYVMLEETIKMVAVHPWCW